jgi:hypothetical protein
MFSIAAGGYQQQNFNQFPPVAQRFSHPYPSLATWIDPKLESTYCWEWQE